MSIKKIISVCSLFSAVTAFTVSAAVDEPYEVGTWANFTQGAVSHTFDDYPQECRNLVTTGRDLFNEANLPMTLFVIVNKCGSSEWDALKKMAEDGHEVGSHGNHQNYDKNFSNTKQSIEQNIPGYKCVSWAFPYCEDVQGTLDHYVAARDCDGSPNSSTPSDFNNIEGQMFAESGVYESKHGVDALNGLADAAVSNNGWSVYLHHGIDSTHSMSTNSSNLKPHLAYLDENRDKIWCGTFGNVALYIKERDAASVTEKSSDEKSFTVSVTDDLEDEIFDYPLSIRRPLPDGWEAKNIKVTQGEEEMEDTVVEVDSKKYIMFQAVPDGGDVTIENTAIVGIASEYRINGITSPVLRQGQELKVSRNHFDGSSVTVTFFNVSGKVIAKQTLAAGESVVSLCNSSLSHCAFIAKVTDGKKTFSDIFMPEM